MLLLNDGSALAAQFQNEQDHFASFKSIPLAATASSRDVLSTLVREISAQTETSNSGSGDMRIWQTSGGYFPAWQTVDGQRTFLIGQGSGAVLSVEAPSLTWRSWRVRLLAFSVCFVGLFISLGQLYVIFSAARRTLRRSA